MYFKGEYEVAIMESITERLNKKHWEERRKSE